MTTQNFEDAQCFACKILLKPSPKPDCQTFWACPDCGTGDSAENVLAECADYAKEQAARRMQEIMRKEFGGGGLFQLKLTPIPHRIYRFFVQMEPHLPSV